MPATTPQKMRTDEQSATIGINGKSALFDEVGSVVLPWWAMASAVSRKACDAVNQLTR